MVIPLGLCSASKLHRSDKHFPGGALHTGFPGLRGSDGKGMIGCIVFLVVIGTAIFLALRLGPLYYSNHNFKSDVETEVSRAGANSLKDETIIDNILAVARMHEIELKREDIKVDHSAGLVHVDVNYAVPVSFGLFKRDMGFQIAASSFIRTP